jgi:hypothetical protein
LLVPTFLTSVTPPFGSSLNHEIRRKLQVNSAAASAHSCAPWRWPLPRPANSKRGRGDRGARSTVADAAKQGILLLLRAEAEIQAWRCSSWREARAGFVRVQESGAAGAEPAAQLTAGIAEPETPYIVETSWHVFSFFLVCVCEEILMHVYYFVVCQ